MLSFDDYKKKYNNVVTIGQQLKQMSDEAMQETFDNNIVTRQCYLYDYYHDDQFDMEYGYNPAQSKTKIPVKLKFIVKTYKSMSKDDPEYHIMFEPNVWNSMSCKPDWFVRNYQKLGVEFPIGLYVDIPDDRGIYHRWMVMYSEVANQFPKFGVLKCNYKFQWIDNDGVYRHKRQMWGINSSQNSYTSGVWRDYKSQIFDNQDKFYLPWNAISSELRHDTRLCISMLQREPWTYQITKVDNTTPKGIITYTVKQDRYDQNRDYVQLNQNEDDYGDMYSDYYTPVHNKDDGICHVEPCASDNFDCTNQSYNVHTLIVEAPNYNIKLGNSKVLTAKIYDDENKDVTDMYQKSTCVWNFKLADTDLIRKKLIIVDTDYSLKEENKFKCKFKFDGDERYLQNNITVTCQIDDMNAEILLDVVTL